ncbi:MAG: dehydrogenase [Caulobacteraceae bacterium]|nr:dehydrogenase [Caulobacteraceae bacterium]
MSETAQALWTVGAGRAELRAAALAPLAEGLVRVRALVSGISRGTEGLVFQGRVPPSERTRMRCPFQEGDFPYPVKYGYAMVGRVEAGAADLLGERVFSLHPHQSLFDVPAQAAMPVPAKIPTARAVLAPQMETALNATWDAPPRAGHRIAVVGGGVIGLLSAYLCARTAGAEVTLIDINPARAAAAQALGLRFAAPDAAPTGCDLVFHASSTAAGLNLALGLAGFEGQVIELSWYGDTPVAVDLGGAFHSQRLTLRASQVGAVAPARRARWDYRRRLAKALSLCADPRLDVLVGRSTPFADMPGRMAAILSGPDTLCHLIQYQES